MLIALASVSLLFPRPDLSPQGLLFTQSANSSELRPEGLLAQTHYLQFDSDGSSFRSNRLVLNTPLEEFRYVKIGLKMPVGSQQYRFQSSGDDYRINLKNSTVLLTVESPFFTSELSFDSVNYVAHWKNIYARYQYQEIPYDIELDINSLSASAQSGGLWQSEQVGAGIRFETLQFGIDYQNQAAGYSFANAYAQIPLMQGRLQISRKEQQFRIANQWQTDNDFRAKTDAQVEHQDLSIGFNAQHWSVSYLQRQVSADAFNQIDVTNNLVASFGKGRYFIIGGADFRQRMLTFESDFQLSPSLHLHTPIELAYFDQLEIKSDTYEPLPFLGIPKLAKSDRVNVKTAALANLGLGLSGKVEAWHWHAHLNQLIPFAIEALSAEEDAAENKPANTHKKTGPLWPGLSMQIGLSVNF